MSERADPTDPAAPVPDLAQPTTTTTEALQGPARGARPARRRVRRPPGRPDRSEPGTATPATTRATSRPPRHLGVDRGNRRGPPGRRRGRPDTAGDSAAAARRRAAYLADQARLDAEAVERWLPIVAAMPRLTDDQINAVAEIFRRIDARRAQQLHTGKSAPHSEVDELG